MDPFLAKLGIEVVKNSKSIGKNIAIFIAAFTFIISAIATSFIAVITDAEGLTKETDPLSSPNVKKVSEAYEEYMEDVLYPEMETVRDDLDEELNPPPPPPDKNKKPSQNDTKEEERVTIDVNIQQNQINLAYILAYLTQIDDDFKSGKGRVDEDDVCDFLDSINRIKSKKISDTEYLVYNAFATPEEVVQLYFSAEPELYLLSFELYTEFTGTDGISEDGMYADDSFANEFNIPDTGLSIPKFYQNDYRNVPYGNGTIASSGCAPTSIAMVLSYLSGTTITPSDVVDFTGNRYYVPGSGSSWNIFSACAEHWNYNCVSLGKNLEMVVNALSEGEPVIVSVGPGKFTKSGHIMVIRGIEEGNFLINDPNKSNEIKYQTDKFPISTVMKEAKNFWAFSY